MIKDQAGADSELRRDIGHPGARESLARDHGGGGPENLLAPDPCLLPCHLTDLTCDPDKYPGRNLSASGRRSIFSDCRPNPAIAEAA
ncbi:hypothetical protein GCM10027456_61100 [Kineosporia babensis]